MNVFSKKYLTKNYPHLLFGMAVSIVLAFDISYFLENATTGFVFTMFSSMGLLLMYLMLFTKKVK